MVGWVSFKASTWFSLHSTYCYGPPNRSGGIWVNRIFGYNRMRIYRFVLGAIMWWLAGLGLFKVFTFEKKQSSSRSLLILVSFKASTWFSLHSTYYYDPPNRSGGIWVNWIFCYNRLRIYRFVLGAIMWRLAGFGLFKVFTFEKKQKFFEVSFNSGDVHFRIALKLGLTWRCSDVKIEHHGNQLSVSFSHTLLQSWPMQVKVAWL